MLSTNFYHPDYSIGCGGSETEMQYDRKTYLYVWNRKEKRHEYYVKEDDLFIGEQDAPWLLNAH